ncbi:TIGR02391 family protein [Georgenia sp. EYE_87]|uniref:TIGR02391 family protein n=1 Tax=Georgenia sp. EYE_87 TaxID=2853448 RepID=UPI002004E929|nr:TIGR02391 family protein [Georgenia sp. EYE_87]MCK6210532.1 TIGR02391 family protein [Georgenia sp. EYE_87]
MNKNIEWALDHLRKFEIDAKPIFVPSPPGTAGFHSYKTTAPQDQVLKQSAVIEKILDKYTPDWHEKQDKDKRYRFRAIWEATQRCIAVLEAQGELDEHLSDRGPTLDGASLHPWIWDSAKPAWTAGLYEDAVDAAARGLNTRLRGKVSRRDLGEGDLIGQLFSQKAADENNPRLRLPLPEGTAEKTVRAIYAGISQYGQGLFSAVRNPLAHEAPGHTGMMEVEALEALAALSLLARWVDRSEVRRG